MMVKVLTAPSTVISQTQGANAMPTAQNGSSQEVISTQARPPRSLARRGPSSEPPSPHRALTDTMAPTSVGSAPRLRASTITISSMPAATAFTAAPHSAYIRR